MLRMLRAFPLQDRFHSQQLPAWASHLAADGGAAFCTALARGCALDASVDAAAAATAATVTATATATAAATTITATAATVTTTTTHESRTSTPMGTRRLSSSRASSVVW